MFTGILWLNGYGQNEHYHERQAIYKIEVDRWGTHFHCVNLETFKLECHEYPQPVEKLFGIGIYYTPGDMASEEEIEEALAKAQELKLNK